ncbi:MAG: thiamine pyrophosphate-binding protein, partial [Oscillospiraceae bacterium]
MERKLLMGNEIIAMGAIKAGVSLVTGYPGTPSTEVLETVAKNAKENDIYVEWSVNEKAALEVAAAASYTGAYTMVTMKQVGLNVASDPLMSLAYVGIKGAMVVMVADDPGPISSQTEQDTRHFAQFSKLPIFDPTSPEEAYEMIQKAFYYSHKEQTPVLFRPTTRICHGCASIEISNDRFKPEIEGFIKDSKWIIFPRLAYQ